MDFWIFASFWITKTSWNIKMENSKYQMKDFMEIPETHKNRSTHRMSSGGKHDDFFDFNFNSSDESFNSNSSSSSKSSSSSEKKNDVNYDLLSGGCGSKGSEQSFNDIDSHNKPEHHKSFVSIIKFFKSSVKSKKTNCQQSILRGPTEYGYVRGISGLPIRVIRSSSPSSASCRRIVKR